MLRNRTSNHMGRGVVTLVAALTLTIVAALPVSAQTPGASRQVCTGYASNQKCDSVDLSAAQSTLASYLQGIGKQNASSPNGDVRQAVSEQVKTIIQQLNGGNLPTAPSGGTPATPTTPVNPQDIEAKLTELQKQVEQYMAQVGNPGQNGTPNPTPPATPGTSPNPSPNPTPNPTPGSNNPNPSPSSGAVDPGKLCESIQSAVDKKVGSLNASAQDALARLDAAFAKLHAYQAGSQQSSPEIQQLMDAATQAQAEATQAVATLSTLSVTPDCSQPASTIAATLSTVKVSADTTKGQLQDFQKSLTDLISGLAAQTN